MFVRGKGPFVQNRNARNEAVQEIVSNLKQVKGDVNAVDIKAKFAALRNNFLVEHRKYITSLKSGAGTNDVSRNNIIDICIQFIYDWFLGSNP